MSFVIDFFLPAHKYQSSPEFGYEEWTRGQNSLLAVEFLVQAERYIWEYYSYYCSIDEVRSMYTPTKWLIDFFKLHWEGIEGEYYDNKGKIVVFDPSVRTSGPEVLLADEDILDALRLKGYEVLWIITAEKIMIGGKMTSSEWKGRLEISGLFRKNDKVFDGFVSSKFASHLNESISI